MAMLLAYNYVEIEDATGMCIGVMTSSNPNVAGPTSCGTTYIRVPAYDEEYMFKYYINGNWYEDEAATIPWQSSLA